MNREQVLAILWLRWRLSRNQFFRAGGLNAVISVLMTAGLVAGSLFAGVGGVLLGAFALRRAPPLVTMLAWDGVVFALLVVWFSGLMVELQRSESIDITKLLHLPVSLKQVFLFNYLASHFTPSLFLFVPALLGLSVGLAISYGPLMLLMAALSLAFILMLTAWTYCLRGWLAALMSNKRRRRNIVMCITVVFVLACQLPNLIFNSHFFGRKRSNSAAQGTPGQTGAAIARGEIPPGLLQAHLVIPPGWLGYGALTLREKNPLPATCATAACALIASLGWLRAYRMTVRFYRADDTKPKPAKGPAPVPTARPKRTLVDLALPGFSEETSALALALFRSLLRSPEVKMALVMPLIAAGGLIAFNVSRSPSIKPGILTALAGAMAAAFSVFSLAPTMANAFGLDRNGFRALVLLPTPRQKILLAKNLSYFPFVIVIALLVLLAIKFLVRLSWADFLAALFQVPIAFLTFSIACNMLSILVPYRLATGTLQAKKPKAIVFVGVFSAMLLMPILVTPAMIPPLVQLVFNLKGWVPGVPVNLLVTLPMLALFGWFYALVLPFEGRLLQTREQKILREVTEEVE